MWSQDDPVNANTKPYLPGNVFTGFGGKRLKFIIACIRVGVKSNLVVLGSSNLLLPGCIIKILSPKTRLILIIQSAALAATSSFAKRKMMGYMDRIIAPGNFVKNKMKSLFKIRDEKYAVLNNCLDPFLPPPPDVLRRKEFRHTYGYLEEDVVLISLSRVTGDKAAGGYDDLFFVSKKLQFARPGLKFLCVGKFEPAEKLRLEVFINALGIEENVIFTGFVPDSLLGDYFNMADLYISMAENNTADFPFPEALYYNKPLIADKIEGDTTGEYEETMGIFIDIRNREALQEAIQKLYNEVSSFKPGRQSLLDRFSFQTYKENLKIVMDHV